MFVCLQVISQQVLQGPSDMVVSLDAVVPLLFSHADNPEEACCLTLAFFISYIFIVEKKCHYQSPTIVYMIYLFILGVCAVFLVAQGVRNAVAECLGRLALLNAQAVVSQMMARTSPSNSVSLSSMIVFSPPISSLCIG